MGSEQTILVVDDIFENRALLARRFGRQGFQIVEAESGLQALDLIAKQQPDIILLDVMMPGMNGFEVLKRVRQTFEPMQLPIIMVTAKSDGSDVAEALEAGANDYVTKPVDFVAALARVKTHLERKKAKDDVDKLNTSLRTLNDTLEVRVAERTADLVQANEKLMQEIEARERSQAEIHYLAHHDSLTGLANRMMLGEDFDRIQADASRQGESVAVLLIDLDGFKSVNDTLGHSVGDSLLKCVAKRLTENVKTIDRVARLGGDEFAIVEVGTEQPRGASTLASRLVELVGQPYIVDGHQISVGASIGIAIANEPASRLEDMLKRADLAMYSAKADGRGTFRFFDPEMDFSAQARRSMELALRSADLQTDFQIYYQPIIDLSRKKVACLEALLRWQHPERGFISPSQFVPLAEETGLIARLGQWVLQEACTEATKWPDDVRVAINLSPVQFRYGDLVKTVRDALATSGLSAARLELEVTESVLLERTEANLAILRELRDLGVTIAIDDFGTGYCSLSYLKSFQFDKVKIDRTFIGGLANGQDSLSIVRAVTDLGRNFGMVTAAEGVETLDQLKCLEYEGCGQVQGFLFSAPRPASEIPALLRHISETAGASVGPICRSTEEEPVSYLSLIA